MQIPLVVDTLAKAKAVDYSRILAYLQLLDLPFWSNHLSQGDKLNLDLGVFPMIETLLSKIWM